MATANKLYGTCEIDQCSHKQVVLAYTFNAGQDPHKLDTAVKDALGSFSGANQISTTFRGPSNINPRGMLIIKGYLPVNGAKFKEFSRSLVAVGALNEFDRRALEDRINTLPDLPPRRGVVGRY